jgi:hypothetical protein
MIRQAPERFASELSRIWQSLTINERISWLHTARAMVRERYPDPVLWFAFAHLFAILILLIK